MLGWHHRAETTEHTESYYAATANTARYPTLEGAITADVVIVGGGFSGVNTALELCERGMQVVVVEANRIGWGASGRNGGQLIGGLGNNPEMLRSSLGSENVEQLHALGDESVDIARRRIEKYAIECDLKWGYCDAALKPRHLRNLQCQLDQFQLRHYPHALQLLDRNEVAELIGSKAYIGGLYHSTGAGHLHPLKLCQGEAAAAAAQGVHIFEQSRVLHIEQGESPRVITESGSVSARHVVLCSNGYLNNLVPSLAQRMVPASSCIIATRPLPDGLANTILPSDIAVCDTRWDLDYYRLSADKRLLFGGLANLTGRIARNAKTLVHARMLQVFPQLEGIEIEYMWNGQMGISKNSFPQIGRMEDNAYFIQAFSGHGVAATHLLARLTAEAICGETARFETLERVPHHPFPGGRYLRGPLAAMGMLHTKLLDRF